MSPWRRKTEPANAPTGPQASGPWGQVFWPDLEQLIPPRELWVGPEDPVSHFLRWPWEYRAYLSLLCGLKPTSRVLEVGCNHGRTMLALVDLLRPPGGYDGFDILPAHIEFAQAEIQSRFPHLRFTHADVANTSYNPSGKISPDDFTFPYEDDSFDIAYAASVFTHLLPSTVSNYLSQTRRVLKPGGKCLYSFFILDRYDGTGTSACDLYEFDHPIEDGVATHDPEYPEGVIAYGTERLRQLAADAGLEVERICPGFWTPSDESVLSEQDLVVLRRPEA